MKRLWGEVSPTVVVNGIVESWCSVSKNNVDQYVSNINHITTILSNLPNSAKLVLNDPQLDCVLSLAFALADKDMIKLDRFITDGIKQKGLNFAFYLVQFLGNEFQRATPKSENKITSVENIATCLKCLQATDRSIQSQRNNNNIELGASIKQLSGE